MSTASAKGAPPGQGVAPLNFIYACSVCCASFSDAYEGRNETVQGLSDGINPKERLVTRVFLASCCHVFCSKHLEGGGPPLHPAGQRPRAPCPVCISEKGDSEPRDLYSIRGFNKDEYDSLIPPSWFTAPPIKLDGNGKEMEALRFQYIALIRYCQNTYAARKPIQNELLAMEDKLSSMQRVVSEEHAKVISLQQENEQLREKQQNCDSMTAEVQRLQIIEQETEYYRSLNLNPRDLEVFITNKAAIRHYLKLIPILTEQNEAMKKRLASLGFAMALEPIPTFKGVDAHVVDSDEPFPGNHVSETGVLLRKTASSHTAGRSAHTSGKVTVAPSSPFLKRPMKRQRLESPMSSNVPIDQPASREAMPPPPKPMSRMQSVRKILPALRKRFSHGHSTATPSDGSYRTGDVQMCETETWRNGENYLVSIRDDSRIESPYMSGALPADQPTQQASSHKSQLLSRTGINDSKSGFTFGSSSPATMNRKSTGHQPVQLPTEPSYIRLMDGLSHDTGVKLGLTDPREDTTRGSQEDNRNRLYQDRHEPQVLESQKHWELGQPFLHQSPHRSPHLAGGNLTAPGFNRTNGYTSGVHQANNPPVTPALSRSLQPGQQMENVVSPFFRRNCHRASVYSKAEFAEAQHSSHHSDVSRSRSSRRIESQPGWRERRSLNGLSFFDSPINSRNEPIQSSRAYQATDSVNISRHYQSRNVDSRGFITRPGTERSPYVVDSPYGSSRDRTIYSRQALVHTPSAIPFPFYKRFTHSLTGQLPSAMPSVISGRSPVRSQTQWESLQRMGVRSSRHPYDGITGNTFASSTRNNLPSASRRTVRR